MSMHIEFHITFHISSLINIDESLYACISENISVLSLVTLSFNMEIKKKKLWKIKKLL